MTNIRSSILVLGLSLFFNLLNVQNARAQAVTLGDASAGFSLIPGATASAQQIRDDLNNGLLSAASRQGLIDAFGKASASNTAGLMFDRSGLATRWIVGLGAHAGMNSPYGLELKRALDEIDQSSGTTLPQIGANAQAGVQIAVKAPWLGIPDIGPIDNDRLMVYVHAGALSPTTNDVSFKMFNIGAGAQYRLIEGTGSVMARWGGVNVAAGLSYSKNEIGLTYRINESDGPVSFSMPFNATIKDSNFLIPMEISTNAQLLYVLSFHAGGGLDWNFGSSKLEGVSDGQMTAPGNQFQNVRVDLSDGNLSGSHSTLVAKGFFGMDVNLYALKIGVNATAFSNKTYNVGAMLRFSM